MNLLKDQMNDILDERQTITKTHQLSNSLIENAHQIAHQSLAANAIKTKSKIENTILKTVDNTDDKNNKSSIPLKLIIDKHEKCNIQFQIDKFTLDKLKNNYKTKIEDLNNQLNEDIKITIKQIKSLKFQGRNILFKIDIESLKSSYFIGKNQTNQLKVFTTDGIESSVNNEILLNEDLSSLTNNYQSIIYDPINKTHQPFLLNQYFNKLSQLREQKKLLIKIRNFIKKLEINKIINDICFEYGSKQSIKQKLLKFDEIIDLDHLKVNKHLELFNSNDFIKQNHTLIDESTDSYKNYVNDFFKNEIDHLEIIEDITNILINSKISIERIKKNEKFLLLLFEIFKENNYLKQFQLIKCTPVYHQYDDPSNIHLIDELIHHFIQSKEKNIELISRIFKCFVKIIENNEQAILCEKKVENFIQFLIINLILIKINFEQGYLLNTIKKDLNSIQINCSSSLFYKLFGELELIILIKEQQFNKLQSSNMKIQIYFKNKEDDVEFEIKVINYIRNNKKSDIFNFFQKYIKLNDNFNGNEYVEEFINNFYLNNQYKSKIKIILADFYDFLINTNELNYNFLINNKKMFLFQLNLFLKKSKNKNTL